MIIDKVWDHDQEILRPRRQSPALCYRQRHHRRPPSV